MGGTDMHVPKVTLALVVWTRRQAKDRDEFT